MSLARRVAVTVGAVVTVLSLGVPAWAGSAGVDVTALSWSSPQVDATTGTATDTLTITVSVPSGSATAVEGFARIAARTSSGFADTGYSVHFGSLAFTNPDPHAGEAKLVSATDVSATYSYVFAVPRYGAATAVTWAVQSVTADGSGVSADLSDADLTAAGFQDGFAATTLADSTVPTLDSVTVASPLPYASSRRSYVSYAVRVHDAESGAWQVKLTLTGPDGDTLDASGGDPILADVPVSADGVITVTAAFGVTGTPYGAWHVSEVDVVDAAGNVGADTGLSSAPVTYTDDSAITATGFTLNPTAPDDWSGAATSTLSMRVTSPAPITSLALDLESPCTAGAPDLSDQADGVVSIPITLPLATTSCGIDGLAVVDSAGDASVYGNDFLVTTADMPAVVRALTGPPPTVSGAAFSPSTVDWATGGTVDLSMDVASWEPGVTDVGVTVTDSNGLVAAYQSLTEPRLESGHLVIPLRIPAHEGLGPLGLSVYLNDAAGDGTTYDVAAPLTVTGSNGVSGFVPVSSPVRVADTRDPAFGAHTLGAGGSMDVALGGVPANATAVVLNVTAIDPTGSSYLTVWPYGQNRPAVSTVNFVPGRTVPNLVTVPVGRKNGVDAVSVYNHTGSVDVAADLFGYYVPDGGVDFVPRSPQRVVDTRSGLGVAAAAPVTGGHPVAANVNADVPASATAVVLNVTAINPTAASNLSVQPGAGTPVTSNLNFVAGQTVANLVVVPAKSFYLIDHSGSVDVAADLVGYYYDYTHGERPVPGVSLFQPATPVRVLDTRNGIGAPRAPLGPGGQLGLPAEGVNGVPSDAAGVVLNITAVGGTADGYLTTWPDGEPRPGTSTVNFTPGQTVANLAEPGPITNGRIDIWNHVGSVDVLADMFGYFVAAA